MEAYPLHNPGLYDKYEYPDIIGSMSFESDFLGGIDIASTLKVCILRFTCLYAIPDGSSLLP